MKYIMIGIILALALTGCKSIDRCLQREIFNECLDKVSKSGVVDGQAVQKCKDISFYLAEREDNQIREGCK